jgi:hypothetical protein
VKHFRKIATELLGFDRRERRGTYLLAVMLTVLLLVRVFTLRPDIEHLNDELIVSAQLMICSPGRMIAVQRHYPPLIPTLPHQRSVESWV